MSFFQHRLFRQGLEMVVWQGLSRVGAFGASVWAARCLGPGNLGISAMVVATVTQVALLINLNQNNALVRDYRRESDPAAHARLVREALSFRLFSSLAVVALVLAGILLLPHDPRWTLALLAGLPLLVNECNQPAWLLQSRDMAPVIQRSSFIQSAVLLLGYALFLRPGAGAGTDLILTAVAAAVAAVFGWTFGLRELAQPPSWTAATSYLARIVEGRWLIVAGISNYLYNAVFISLVGYLVSIPDAGLFRVANGLALQLSLLTAIGQQLLFPRFIDLSRKDPVALRHLQNKIAMGVVITGILAVLAAALASGPLLSLLYGAAFVSAATPFTLLIATRFFAATASVYAFGLWAQGEDRAMAGVMTFLAAATLGFSFIVIPRYGIVGAAYAALFGEVASLALTLTVDRVRAHRLRTPQPATA